MDQPKDPATTETRPSMSPNVQISVTNFGPIAEGTIDLRPLTVFVGPSNTGKTYLAVLIYALHRVLGGFTRFPERSTIYYRHNSDDDSVDNAIREEEIRNIQEKLGTEVEQSLKFSDLPEKIRDAVHAYLNDPDKLGAHLNAELLRCFDLESVSDLNQSFGGTPRGLGISLSISEKDQVLWRFNADTSQADIVTNGQIEDIPLLREGPPSAGPEYDAELHRVFSDTLNSEISKRLYRENQPNSGLDYRPTGFGFANPFIADIGEISSSSWAYSTGPRLSKHSVGDLAIRSAYYLPAARTGIMQSHRVIASSLATGAVRAGFERFELPTLSGIVGDFLRRLILYEEGRRKTLRMGYWPSLFIPNEVDQKAEELSKPIKEIADALERHVIAGQIQTRKTSPGAYPEFEYRAMGTTQDIRLSRASSMVSELAPVILFLRGVVERGDMLFFEEPEAHLHPAAQTRMAEALSRIVRAGVKVVVTTHSDWLLQEIANLIREGELEEQTGEPAGEGDLPSSLRPSEVGIWLFRKDDDSAGSIVKEIPFDRSEGIGPEEYEEVAEELYNRSTNLQNRLEDIAGDAERGDE